jgi:hypothetical protein
VIYDRRMVRALAIIIAAALPLAGSAVAAAEPTPAPSPCAYRLSPPQVVGVSGTSMVTATLSVAGCDAATTYLSVVCIQVEGGSGPGSCGENNGILTAQVYFTPYQPGATYVSTGRGCATTGNPPQPTCQPLGPKSATL